MRQPLPEDGRRTINVILIKTGNRKKIIAEMSRYLSYTWREIPQNLIWPTGYRIWIHRVRVYEIIIWNLNEIAEFYNVKICKKNMSRLIDEFNEAAVYRSLFLCYYNHFSLLYAIMENLEYHNTNTSYLIIFRDEATL